MPPSRAKIVQTTASAAIIVESQRSTKKIHIGYSIIAPYHKQFQKDLVNAIHNAAHKFVEDYTRKQDQEQFRRNQNRKRRNQETSNQEPLNLTIEPVIKTE